MKRFVYLLMAMTGLVFACGPKQPTPEEIDHKAAVEADSLANDLQASTDQLQSETDDLDKTLDELAKD